MTYKQLLFLIQIIIPFVVWSNSNDIYLIYPYNNSIVQQDDIEFKWKSNSIKNQYKIEISEDSLFQNIFHQSIVVGTKKNLTINANNVTLYWRVFDLDNYSVSDIFSFRKNVISNINGRILWLMADSGVVKNSFDAVSSWDNINSPYQDAIQSTANRQPLYISSNSLLNFKPSIRFDGSNDLFNYHNYDSLITSFFLVKHNTGTQALPAIIGGTSTSEYHGGDNTLLFREASISNLVKNGNIYRNGILGNVIAERKPTEFTYFSLTATGFTKTNILGNDRLTNNRTWNGDIVEVIYFNKELSNTERTDIEKYLRFKYAPPVTLYDSLLVIVGDSLNDLVNLAVQNRFANFNWSNGATLNSTNVVTNNEYTITTRDVFGNETKDKVILSPYKRINKKTVVICDGDTLKIDLQLPPNWSATWSNGDIGSTAKLHETGEYTVEIVDPLGRLTMDTITIQSSLFGFNKNSSNGIMSSCKNDTIFIVSNVGIETAIWNDSIHSNFYIATQNEQVTVYIKSLVGCEYRDTFTINIVGEKPSVDFTTGNALCEKQAIQLTDASFPPFGNSISNWEWSFSDTTIALEQNPQKIFQSIGNKVISLKVTTDVGCFNQISKNVIINKKPKAIFDNLLSCAGSPTQFRDFTIPNTDSINQWEWNFNNMGTSTLKNPLFTFANNGLYYAFLKATNTNNCFDTLTRPVGVNISPNANFISDSIACRNSTITFNNTSTVAFPHSITSFNWLFGDSTQNNFLFNPSHAYTNSGSYNVRLIVRANNLCTDTIAKNINIYNKPNVDFNISDNKCVGQNILFQDASTISDNSAINSWNWMFDGFGNSNSQNPSFTFNEQGNYTIQLNASTNKGCSATKVKTITVTQPSFVDFSFTPSNGLPPLAVSFNNLSAPGATFTWNFGDGGPLFVGANPPNYTYSTIGNYPITLTSSNFLGCTNSITKYILVDVAYVDAELISLATIQNGEYYKTIMVIKNNSNIPIYNLELTVKLGNGNLVKEIWNGVLLPNQTLNYTFASEIKFKEGIDIPIVCANIESVNFNTTENNILNNSSCENFKVGNFDVLTLYPNPSSNSINIGVMMPEDGAIDIYIVNYLGQRLITKPLNASKGYNLIPVDISLLQTAHYYIQVKYNDNLVNKIFMKK